MRKMAATNRSAEKRKESSKTASARLAKLTPKERSDIVRKGVASQTPEQRKAKSIKGAANQTPEQRRAKALKGVKTRRKRYGKLGYQNGKPGPRPKK
jgi:hypothetical protein